MSRLFLTTICCFFIIQVNAQWQALNGPCGTGVGSLYVGDSVMYAGGRFQTGEFFKSTDDGSHWESINNGLPHTEEVGEFAVCDSLIFATTGTGDLYRAHTSDYLWCEAGAGLPANTRAGFILKHDSLLFLSTNYGLFKSDDTGNTWEPSDNGISETCFTLLTEQENSIFVGTCYGDIYFSENNGDSWTGYNTSTLPEIYISSLIKMDSIMVVGSQYSIYRTTDRGSTWQMVTSDTIAYDITDMISDSDFIYASTFSQGILRSEDQGVSWAPIDSGLLYPTVYDLAKGNGFLIAGTMGGAFKSFNQGESWIISNDGLTNTSISDLVYDGNSFFAASYLGVSRSTDNGNSWKLVLTPPPMQGSAYVSCLYWFDSMLYAGFYCIGFDCSGLFRSADGGDTWEKVNDGLVYKDILVINSKDSILFAGTRGGLFRSTDNGNTWSLVYDGQTIYDIACTGDSVFIACYPGVYCSPDNGDTWMQVNNGLDNPWFFSLYSTGSKLFGGAAYLYRSAINPVAWEKTITGINLPATVHAITSNDSLLFFGDWRGVYVSLNDGDDWFLSDSGFPEPVFVYSLLVRDSILYAGTQYGIWKRPLSEMFLMEATPDTVILDWTSGSMDTLYISSKSNWSITGTMPTWLEANPQTGNGNDTVIFRSLEMNSNGQSRTIELEITAYLSTSVKIIVTQKGKSASIGEGQFEPVRVYPVPSRGSFCVESQFPVNQITVFSSDGTILERREGTPGKQKEMFTTGRKGILFIKIQIADRIFIRKVVAY